MRRWRCWGRRGVVLNQHGDSVSELLDLLLPSFVLFHQGGQNPVVFRGRGDREGIFFGFDTLHCGWLLFH